MPISMILTGPSRRQAAGGAACRRNVLLRNISDARSPGITGKPQVVAYLNAENAYARDQWITQLLGATGAATGIGAARLFFEIEIDEQMVTTLILILGGVLLAALALIYFSLVRRRQPKK